MLSNERFNEDVTNLTLAYQTDEERAKKLEEQLVETIRGPRTLKPGETLESARYYERMEQYIEFHRLVAKGLVTAAQENGHRRFFEHAVDQTVKSLKVVASHYDLRDLEEQATILYVDRPDLPKDTDLISGGIGGVLERRESVLEKLARAKEKVTLIFAPLIDQPLEAYSNHIIVPYGDQLVEMVSDYSPETAIGKLVGTADCIVNVGVEDTRRLSEPLRYYPTDAAKRYTFCLELNPTGDLALEHSTPPRGISKNLAGLQSTFIPVVNLDNDWNGLIYPRR